MASFFSKARERAEAAAQQLQAHASGAASAGKTNTSQSGSNFSYTGSVPHLLRQGLASVDPRYEANRQFHLLSQAVKSLNIDHEAAGRESKNLAKATFNWGQSHLPENREDSVGDEMLVDVTDRLAYIWHEIGLLEISHSQRSEQARSKLKHFEKAEMELSARRLNRNKLKKELHALVPERAKVSGANRATDAEKQLQDLISQDQSDEESLSKLKRESVKDGYGAMFDSLIELGEKLALVARYGKLLANDIPTEKSPFPATIKPRGDKIPLWEGATRTAEIRAAVAPALAAHQSDPTLPSLPRNPIPSDTSSLGRSDTVSYRVSHRAELEDSAAPTQASAVQPSSPPPARERRSSSISDISPQLNPSSTAGSEGNPRLNLSPTVIPAPALPPRGQGGALPRSPTSIVSNPFADQTMSSVEGAEVDQTPPGPTVAETGVVPSGTGGPKSGTLGPRRASTNQRSASISAGSLAYLGPPGTYTHQAALKLFGERGTNLIPMQSITGAIDFVRRGTPGNAKMAIVPVENSTFGPVQDTVDGLLGIDNGDRHAVDPSQGAKVHVIGETRLSIEHALLCGPKTYHHLLRLQGETDPNAQIRDDTLSNITNVISHEQALGQCSHFLSRYLPRARTKSVESTAAAATTALEFEAGTAPGVPAASVSHSHESLGFSSSSLVVAIGPPTTVSTTGVRLLRTKIQDAENNQTRFFVLSSEPVDALLNSQTLPDGLAKLYAPHAVEGREGRALIRLHDPLVEKNDVQGTASALSDVVEELGRGKSWTVRKIDRRPAAFYASKTLSSNWKCSYLFELQFNASDIGRVTQEVSRVVQSLSLSSTTGEQLPRGAEVDYLGSWVIGDVTAQAQVHDEVGSVAPTPAQSGASSSLASSATAQTPTSALSERERKELEASREAAEVQRLAAQARFARDQQQAELYGVGSAAQPGQSRLAGLQESSDEQPLPEGDEGLPAYQPMDPSAR